MKKTTLYLLLCLIYSGMGFAQVTLTMGNMLFGPYAYNPITLSMTGFIQPQGGPNQQWNYGGLSLGQAYAYHYVAPASSFFPSATYADTTIPVSFIGNSVIYQDYYYGMNANAVNCQGQFTKAQNYNIASMTGGPNDSCFFPEQHVVYTTPYPLIKFPATYQSVWETDTKDKVDFSLKIVAYGLNHTAFTRKTIISRKDSVEGWGTMTVPTASGPSLPYSCLMVERSVALIDSFFMGNQLAPAALLNAFSLSQGMMRITNRYLFWRPNAIYPLMMVNFGEDFFTTPASVYVDGDASPATGIMEPETGKAISIFPNPASDRIQLSGLTKAEVFITDLSGRNILTINNLTAGSEINVARLPVGLYSIRIAQVDQQYIRKLAILR